MPWQCDDIQLLESPFSAAYGAPLQVSVDLIDEDPGQPRKEFEPARMEELRQSIAERGVLQPVSIRPHPERPERWMLNFGARRLRASRAAGRPTIPAYVDREPGDYDQVIENEQREGLEPLELALFVRGRLQAGDSRAEVARQLSKSNAFITMVLAMIEPPDCLMRLYRERKCRGLLELYELRRLHVSHPAHIERWLESQTEISRSEVLALKAKLTKGAPAARTSDSTSDLPLRDAAGFNMLKSGQEVIENLMDEAASGFRSPASRDCPRLTASGPGSALLGANLEPSIPPAAKTTVTASDPPQDGAAGFNTLKGGPEIIGRLTSWTAGTTTVSTGRESESRARRSPKALPGGRSLTELVVEATDHVAVLEGVVSAIRTNYPTASADATADLSFRLQELVKSF